jgi:hypothetical protein
MKNAAEFMDFSVMNRSEKKKARGESENKRRHSA